MLKNISYIYSSDFVLLVLIMKQQITPGEFFIVSEIMIKLKLVGGSGKILDITGNQFTGTIRSI